MNQRPNSTGIERTESTDSGVFDPIRVIIAPDSKKSSSNEKKSRLEEKLKNVDNKLYTILTHAKERNKKLDAMEKGILKFWEYSLSIEQSKTPDGKLTQLKLHGWGAKMDNIFCATPNIDEKIEIAERAQKLWGNLTASKREPNQNMEIYKYAAEKLKNWNLWHLPLKIQQLQGLSSEKKILSPKERPSSSTSSMIQEDPDEKNENRKDNLGSDLESLLSTKAFPISQPISESSLTADYKKAINPKQESEVIISAISHYYPLVIVNSSNKHCLMPPPRLELQSWNDLLTKLYEQQTEDPIMKLILLNNAQSCFLDLLLTHNTSDFISTQLKAWNQRREQFKNLSDHLASAQSGSKTPGCLLM